MTAISMSSPALNQLKAHRDAAARAGAMATPSGARAFLHERSVAAAKAFSAWFTRHHAAGELATAAEGVLQVTGALSREFCVGLHDMRYYIGIPPNCALWLLDLPWLYASVARDSSVLSLVCDGVQAPGVSLPSFRLNFDVQPVEYLNALVHYHFLDVRAIADMPAAGGPFHISREVYLTLPVRVGAVMADASRPAYEQPLEHDAPRPRSIGRR